MVAQRVRHLHPADELFEEPSCSRATTHSRQSRQQHRQDLARPFLDSAVLEAYACKR